MILDYYGHRVSVRQPVPAIAFQNTHHFVVPRAPGAFTLLAPCSLVLTAAGMVPALVTGHTIDSVLLSGSQSMLLVVLAAVAALVLGKLCVGLLRPLSAGLTLSGVHLTPPRRCLPKVTTNSSRAEQLRSDPISQHYPQHQRRWPAGPGAPWPPGYGPMPTPHALGADADGPVLRTRRAWWLGGTSRGMRGRQSMRA